jgi:hypothetical protein
MPSVRALSFAASSAAEKARTPLASWNSTRTFSIKTLRYLLSDPTVDFVDLGPDFYDTRGGTKRAIRNHIRGLQALGYTVTLHPAA